MNRRDPRIRQTLDHIQSNLETANLNAQASLYDFAEVYLVPCFQSIGTCLENTCTPCLNPQQTRRTRARHLSRSNRPELSFDFYNDLWDEDYGSDDEASERTGLLTGWGAPDMDRLLAGSGSRDDQQPQRNASMNYGSRGPPSAGLGGPGKGRGGAPSKGIEGHRPDEVPASSMFGFLESLPWKIGRRGLRYKPSAANLQENPQRKDTSGVHLLEQSDEEDELPRRHHRRGLSAVIAGRGAPAEGSSSHQAEGNSANGGPSRPTIPSRQHSDGSQQSTPSRNGHGRNRSGTAASHATTTSLSSRGDLFPSDDEDDAVPLDDEFAMSLERRTTNSGGGRRSSAATSGDRRRRSDAESAPLSRGGSGDRSAGSGRSRGGRSQASQSRSVVVDSEEDEPNAAQEEMGDERGLEPEIIDGAATLPAESEVPTQGPEEASGAATQNNEPRKEHEK